MSTQSPRTRRDQSPVSCLPQSSPHPWLRTVVVLPWARAVVVLGPLVEVDRAAVVLGVDDERDDDEQAPSKSATPTATNTRTDRGAQEAARRPAITPGAYLLIIRAASRTSMPRDRRSLQMRPCRPSSGR